MVVKINWDNYKYIGPGSVYREKPNKLQFSLCRVGKWLTLTFVGEIFFLLLKNETLAPICKN